VGQQTRPAVDLNGQGLPRFNRGEFFYDLCGCALGTVIVSSSNTPRPQKETKLLLNSSLSASPLAYDELIVYISATYEQRTLAGMATHMLRIRLSYR
jgi:hypothetical protein